MGLGHAPQGSGAAAARYFALAGADVIVTDRAPRRELRTTVQTLQGMPIRMVLGRHRVQDFQHRDLIVQNPAVSSSSPFLAVARREGIPIETDVSLFFQMTNRPILGVSGTRGKSTTTVLLHRMLRTIAARTLLGGNLRVSPLADPSRVRGSASAVLELSSWMLESLQHLRRSPALSVLTNYYPDHLDRYPNFEAYVRSKYPLFLYQRATDDCVLNRDDVRVRALARNVPSRVSWFSFRRFAHDPGAFVDGRMIVVRSRGRVQHVCQLDTVKLPGRHNLANVLAATAAAAAWGVPVANIRKVLASFRGLPHRLERVRTVRGVTYMNDSASTVPDATRVALETIARPTILIAGGENKNLSYTSFGAMLQRHDVRHLLLLPGSATRRMIAALPRRPPYAVRSVPTIAQAVRIAAADAVSGMVVLCSPGATSFGQFANAYERGDAFRSVVRALPGRRR
ncbi:MAG: UDP-N-acetylmuramoyl-L-alanine--D-glutamate ligase [Candidatus Kerfeldbacteria bacterium]|nr:UDP-N-acetylmuramoyl-L-alanine--D-glutamate ligase [Candidatus Kerfeldbacteria bacterium]